MDVHTAVSSKESAKVGRFQLEKRAHEPLIMIEAPAPNKLVRWMLHPVATNNLIVTHVVG